MFLLCNSLKLVSSPKELKKSDILQFHFYIIFVRLEM